MDPIETIRPEQSIFVLRPVFWTLATVLLMLPPTLIVLRDLDVGAGLQLGAAGVGALIVAAVVVDRLVAYGKTRYEIYENHIVHRTGGLLSTQSTNLPFRNVTQIRVHRPWLEHKFYETGHLAVHAAGCARGHVNFRSVRDPERIYEALLDGLRRNGFPIDGDVVARTKPHAFGAWIDMGRGGQSSGIAAFAPIIGLVVVLLAIIGLTDINPLTDAFEMATGSPDATGVNTFETTVLVGILAFAGAWGVVMWFIRFRDLTRRTYTLSKGAVRYEDGFLSTCRRIIPIANVADTHLQEDFWKRMLGVADLTVSCQGDSGDIHFPSLPGANRFRRQLDELIATAERPEIREQSAGGTKTAAPASGVGASVEASTTHTAGPPTLGDRQAPTRTYQIDMLRAAAPAGFAAVATFLVLAAASRFFSDLDIDTLDTLIEVGPVYGAGLVAIGVAGSLALVPWITERFAFGSGTVSWSREMISEKSSTEFTIDQITAVVVHRSPLDRFFDTASIDFHSIGHDERLRFRHLPDFRDLSGELERRFGISTGEPAERIEPEVTVANVVFREAPTLLILAGLLAAILGAGIVIPEAMVAAPIVAILMVCLIPYGLVHDRFFHLDVFDHHLMVKSGWIFQQRAYIPIHHTRNIVSIEYPRVDSGRLTIDAGGRGAKFSIEQIPDVASLHDGIDRLMYDNPPRAIDQPPEFDVDEQITWQPTASNDLVVNCALAAVTVVGLPVAYWYTRAYYDRASCRLESRRLVQHRGIYFKRRASVLFNRIDQLQTHRGPLNTFFDNGMVKVFTVGSGKAELVLGPHDNHADIQRTIEEHLP